MAVRISRASAVVVHRVPESAGDWFMDWQRDVSTAAEAFEGYRGTDLYPPSVPSQNEWVAVLHFDDEKSLQRWLDSPERAARLRTLSERVDKFDLKTLPGGFGPWFAGLTAAGPPGWKMVAVVLLGLYPTVMLLTIFVSPYVNPWGMAASMLVGNLLSVALLQYAVMPVLSKVFAPWINAKSPQRWTTQLGGLVVIAILLAALMLAFRQKTG
jgi:antibiotic biosynthesis monooxygenase (ABM) superfamily enzyme